jgi:hypothetical protein
MHPPWRRSGSSGTGFDSQSVGMNRGTVAVLVRAGLVTGIPLDYPLMQTSALTTPVTALMASAMTSRPYTWGRLFKTR